MTAPLTTEDDRLLVGLTERSTGGVFDRFYVNLHGEHPDTLLLFGGGVYPAAGIVDAWLIAAVGGVQRNVRFSTEIAVDAGPDQVVGVGPFSWSAPEPGQRWRFDLDANLSGVELHADLVGRLPMFGYRRLEFQSTERHTSFDHAVQSGKWDGSISVDGHVVDVTGWWGQRDRSRGVRGMHAGQGIHLWMQPQFAAWQVSLMYDESREGQPALCDGAVIGRDGSTDPIVGVEHNLKTDSQQELQELELRLTTISGRIVDLAGDCIGAGGPYLQGGGYDGRHGKWQGHDHQSGERWILGDGRPSPRTLRTPYAHRLTCFAHEGEIGWGVTEFAMTRHPEYRYRATLRT